MPLQTISYFFFNQPHQSAVTSQHMRRVTVPCYPTIRTTILTQGRWRSDQPPGEPARNNIPVSWKKSVIFQLSLIAERKNCCTMIICREEKELCGYNLTTYDCEAFTPPLLKPFLRRRRVGSCEKAGRRQMIRLLFDELYIVCVRPVAFRICMYVQYKTCRTTIDSSSLTDTTLLIISMYVLIFAWA